MDLTELRIQIFRREFLPAIAHQPLEESRKMVSDLIKLLEYKKQAVVALLPQASSLVSGLETLAISFLVQTTQDRQVLSQSAEQIYRMGLTLDNIRTQTAIGIF